jgi:hypothetical protein
MTEKSIHNLTLPQRKRIWEPHNSIDHMAPFLSTYRSDRNQRRRSRAFRRMMCVLELLKLVYYTTHIKLCEAVRTQQGNMELGAPADGREWSLNVRRNGCHVVSPSGQVPNAFALWGGIALTRVKAACPQCGERGARRARHTWQASGRAGGSCPPREGRGPE